MGLSLSFDIVVTSCIFRGMHAHDNRLAQHYVQFNIFYFSVHTIWSRKILVLQKRNWNFQNVLEIMYFGVYRGVC